MASLNAISEAMRAKLAAAIPTLRTFDYLPDTLPTPCAVVTSGGITYDTVMARGCDEYTMNVFLIVARVTDRWAQSQLGEYVASSGTQSVKAILEADHTLSGTAQMLRVSHASQPIQYPLGEVTYLAVEFTVEVFA